MRGMAKLQVRDNNTYIAFQCPGCSAYLGQKQLHGIPVKPHPQGWEWNGDASNPTLRPSIDVTYNGPANPQTSKPHRPARCHSHITEGKIIYCSDSTHDMAGQSVELPEV